MGHVSWLRSRPRKPVATRNRAFQPAAPDWALESRLVLSTFTWTGALSGSWAEPANWAGGQGPTGLGNAGDTLVFPATAAHLDQLTNDVPALGIASLQFGDTSYHVAGRPFLLNASLNTDPGATVRIDAQIVTGAGVGGINPRVFFHPESGTTLTFGAQLAMLDGSPGVLLDLNTPGTSPILVRFEQGLSGAGQFYVNGPTSARVEVYGTSTLTGPVDLTNSTLYVDQSNGLGTGTLGLSGTLEAGNQVVLSNSIQLFGAVFGPANQLTLTGPVVFAGSNLDTVTVQGSSTRVASVVMNGPVSGIAPLVVGTNGALTINGPALGYTGPTTVLDGFLYVNAPLTPMQVDVEDPGILGGIGLVQSVVSPALLAPGLPGGGGALTVGTLQQGLQFLSVNVGVGTDPGASSRLDLLSGALDLAGATLNLNVSPVASFKPGTVYTILRTDGPLTGQFAGAPSGTVYPGPNVDFQLAYGRQGVTLTAIPPNGRPALLDAARAPGPVTTQLVVTFDRPMNPATLTRPGLYRLRTAGRDGRLGNADDRFLRVTKATPSASGRSVLLTLSRPVPAATALGLRVVGGPRTLRSTSGQPLALPRGPLLQA